MSTVTTDLARLLATVRRPGDFYAAGGGAGLKEQAGGTGM